MAQPVPVKQDLWMPQRLPRTLHVAPVPSPMEQPPVGEPGDEVVRKFKLRHEVHRASNLSRGWDGYTAAPPGELAVGGALKGLDVLYKLKSLPRRVVALVDGGLALVLMARPFYAALEIYNDGEVVAAFSDRAQRQLAWDVGLEEGQLGEATERLRDLMNG